MANVLRAAGGGVILAAVAVLPLVITGSYVLHILIMTGINLMVASALDLVLGHLELLSLAQIAFFGIGAYTSALLHLDASFSFWQAVPLAGLVSAFLGFVIGLVTLRLRGPYFVIVTLGLAQIIHIVSLNWVDFTRGPMGLVGIAPPAWPFRADLPFTDKVSFYYLVLVFALATLFVKHRLTSSYIGVAWRSIREDENLAESIGISAFGLALLAFVLGAGMAGIAGSVYVHYIRFLSPEIFEFSNVVGSLVMVIVGGRATLLGPVIGAALFTVLLEYLRIAGGLRLPILGLLLMAAMFFFPQGFANIPLLGGRPRRWKPGLRGTGSEVGVASR
jgi:branched-chain amino acid transport system permease protein